MKKIFLSLAIIFAVGAIVVGATSSYFSDTETSKGNTFAAGDIDLTLGGESFSYDDIKPGDYDKKDFTLKVESNDACGFVSVKLAEDKDNSCNEPETVAEPACDPEGPGELNDNLKFTIYDEVGNALTSGTLTGDENYAIGKLVGGTEYKYTIAWELPAGVGNEAQTDSFIADLEVKADQQRNIYDTDCNEIAN